MDIQLSQSPNFARAFNPTFIIYSATIWNQLQGLWVFTISNGFQIAAHIYSAKDVTKLVLVIDSAECFQIRTHSVLYEADNVLTPAVIQAMYHQRKQLQNLKSGNKSFQVGNTFYDHCIFIFYTFLSIAKLL